MRAMDGALRHEPVTGTSSYAPDTHAPDAKGQHALSYQVWICLQEQDFPVSISKFLPAIILSAPQLGENIGTCARAMANFGLDDLRLVGPRDGWPNARAIAPASGADHVLDAARCFDDLACAVSDLHMVFATTARPREVDKPVVGPQMAAHASLRLGRQGRRAGYLFGCESCGLDNEDIALADQILTLPVNPAFASLNIAQAVIICAYEWRRVALAAPAFGAPATGQGAVPYMGRPGWSISGADNAGTGHDISSAPSHRPAARGELFALFHHLESELDAAGYFHPPGRRRKMVHNLRNAVQKAGLSSPEIRGFRGMISALARARRGSG